MFYLLENNRIIDSDEYFKYAYAYKNGITYYNIAIKKQSENVFDLIENGDLIKIKMCDTFNILEVCRINGGVNGMKHIIAIYKPDSKGNFIKVWEVKEDEKEIYN